MAHEWEQGQAYVHSLRAQGYSETDIWAAMRQAGWEEMQIQNLLATQPLPAMQPPPAAQPMGDQPPLSVGQAPVGIPARGAQPSSGSRALLIAGILAGALFLLVVGGSIVLTAVYLRSLRLATPAPPPSPPARSSAEAQPRKLPPAAEIPPGASSEAALKAAQRFAGEGRWDCSLDSRTQDWREAAVRCKPAGEDEASYVYEVGLEWDETGTKYTRAIWSF